MLLGLSLRALHGYWVVAPGFVESLPGTKGSTHRVTNEEIRAVFADHLQNLLCFIWLGEIPRLAVVLVVGCEVESESWEQAAAPSLAELGGDPWR